MKIEKKAYKLKSDNGITLVSLIVTIVVLIILATISIKSFTSDNGVANRAQREKEIQANQIKEHEEKTKQLLEEFNSMVTEP